MLIKNMILFNKYNIFFLFLISFPLLANAKTNNTDDFKSISYDKYLNGYDYPFKLQKYQFKSQEKNLEMIYMYLPAKNSDKGLVTLLHGKNFNGSHWKETANLLHTMGYSVLIPDQVGFGKSSKPLDYQYSFEALANNTKNLLEHKGFKSTQFIAHSMGGMLASRFGLMFPEVTKRIILVNPIGLENYLHYVEYKDINFFYKNELKLKPQNIIDYQKKNYYDGAWNDKYERLTWPLIGWLNGSDKNIIAKVSAKAYDMIFTGPVIEEFKYFKMPVSIIIGTRDRTGPGRNWKKAGVEYKLGRYDNLGKKIKNRNPKINIIELDGIGHMPQVEDFERYRKALEVSLKYND